MFVCNLPGWAIFWGEGVSVSSMSVPIVYQVKGGKGSSDWPQCVPKTIKRLFLTNGKANEEYVVRYSNVENILVCSS